MSQFDALQNRRARYAAEHHDADTVVKRERTKSRGYRTIVEQVKTDIVFIHSYKVQDSPYAVY